VGPEPQGCTSCSLAAGEPVRHLGILLSATDQEAASQQMFAKRLVAVRLRVRAWSKFDLSYLGRAHVEQQVLATSLYFHASFLLPSDALLADKVSCLDRFVAAVGTSCQRIGPMAMAQACWLLAGFLSVEAAQAAGTSAPAPARAACQQVPHH
jgi:hypothetical protein